MTQNCHFFTSLSQIHTHAYVGGKGQ